MKSRHEPNAFSDLEDKDIAGGCSDCNAFQRLTKSEVGVWNLTTYHDSTCPFLLRRKADNAGGGDR